MKQEKKLRIHDLVYSLVDTYTEFDEEKKKGYKFEFMAPFLDYLQTDLDNDLNNINQTKNSELFPMFDYMKTLNILRSRYESIGLDAISNKDEFRKKLEDMCLEWVQFKSWYQDSAFKCRRNYYIPKSREKEEVSQVDNNAFSEINALKDRISNNKQNINW